MALRLKHRLAREEGGFSLIELLVVIVILGILVAIAVPAYVSLKKRSESAAAQADVRAAIPDIELWGQDHVTGYTSATTAKLKASYDAGIEASLKGTGLTQVKYCLYSTVGVRVAYVTGPGGTIKVSSLNQC